MNPTDWAAIEDGLAELIYDELPRKRRPMPVDPFSSDDFLMGGRGYVHEEDPDPDDDPPFILARYDGLCSSCGEFHIIAGVTEIRADGIGGWEAEECAW